MTKNTLPYKWEEDAKFAVQAAIARNRPLLIRGEPGIGKSSLARAAAELHERYFIEEVITAKTEPNDLLWQFDGVMRLGDATAICNMDQKAVKEVLNRRKYTTPGVLWWAFQAGQALELYEQCPSGVCPSEETRKSVKALDHRPPSEKTGWVVLIDEIDKADADVPNSLLGALAEHEFSVPGFDAPVRQDTATPAPLIIITTNEERELPPAFLRRCFVLHMDFPKQSDTMTKSDVITWMKERAELHISRFDSDFEQFMETIANILLDERRRTTGRHKPGLSEYIDFVCSFEDMLAMEQQKTNPRSPEKLMELITMFTLKKNARS